MRKPSVVLSIAISGLVLFAARPAAAQTFTGPESFVPFNALVAGVGTGNFNGDGRADFVAIAQAQTSVRVLLRGADGTFSILPEQPTQCFADQLIVDASRI